MFPFRGIYSAKFAELGKGKNHQKRGEKFSIFEMGEEGKKRGKD